MGDFSPDLRVNSLNLMQPADKSSSARVESGEERVVSGIKIPFSFTGDEQRRTRILF
jgi:hypothetical protein